MGNNEKREKTIYDKSVQNIFLVRISNVYDFAVCLCGN